MLTPMASTTRGIALKKVLIVCVCLLTFWSAVAAVVSLVFTEPFIVSMGLAMPVVFGSSFLAFVVSWLRGRACAGAVLLDCGPFPMRRQALGLAFFSVVMGCGLAGTSLRVFGIPAVIFGILSAAWYVIAATGRLQLREKGIWVYLGLLRWEEIGSYRWADDSTLLWKKNSFPGLQQGMMRIPPEHRQTFIDVLAGRCSAESFKE